MNQRYEMLLSMLNRLGTITVPHRDIGHGQRLIDRGKAAFVSYQTDGYTDQMTIKNAA
jgi:hypothetical protein